MRLAFVVRHLPPHGGGIGSYVRCLADEMLRSSPEVDLRLLVSRSADALPQNWPPTAIQRSPLPLHALYGALMAEGGPVAEALREPPPDGLDEPGPAQVASAGPRAAGAPAQYELLGSVTVGTGARIVRDVEAEASVDG